MTSGDFSPKAKSEFSIKKLILSRRPDFTISCSVGNNKQIEIPINLVSCVESDGVICKFHYYENLKNFIRIAHNISECEERLKMYAFIRVHRSFIINCSYIEKIKCKREGLIYLSDGRLIPISRRKKEVVIASLKEYGFDHLLGA